MYPELIRVGDFVITTFGLMMVCAFVLSNYLLRKDMKNKGHDPKIADDLVFWAAIGGILGAKIYYIVEIGGLENLYGFVDILSGIFSLSLQKIVSGIQNFGSGLVFLGGLIGGLISVTIYVYKHKLKWLEIADFAAPLLALGHGIGRIGCFLVGDCYGKPTELPWGVTFKNGVPPTTAYNLRELGASVPDNVPMGAYMNVHPTQLYECVLYVGIYLYLRKLSKSSEFSGSLFLNYLFLVGLCRFTVEFLRLNPQYFLSFSGAQILSLGMVIFSSILFFNLRNKNI